jgi:glycosyltransferase involved in cell wall biosynthesis
MLLENSPYPQDPRVRNEARALVGAGWRVTVLAPYADRGQARRELVEGVEVVRYWLPTTPSSVIGHLLEYAVAHAQLARLTLTRLLAGADVVHVNNPPDTLALLFPLVRLLGGASVFDNHDLFPELFELRYSGSRMGGLLRIFQRLAFRSADLVLATNESQREVVLDAVGRDPQTVVVVRNGPRRETLRAASEPASDAGTGRAGLELVFLGALEPQDGVVTLAEVLAILVERYQLDARLTVIGIGSARGELEARCSELGIEGRVVFTGWVVHEEVPRLLANADVCLDPAACNELNHRSTMIKIAEYMAAGKPIVAFDLRETRRTAGDAVLYAGCDDVEGFAAHVVELAGNPALRSELTEHAAVRLPQLLWEHSAETLVTAYGRLRPE